MDIKGQRHFIHRECLGTAPLPDTHRQLLLRTLRHLQKRKRPVSYSVVEYNSAEGVCWLHECDTSEAWPEIHRSYEYRDSTRSIRVKNFRAGSGLGLHNQASILPKWHQFAEAAKTLEASARESKLLTNSLRETLQPSNWWKKRFQDFNFNPNENWIPNDLSEAKYCNLDCPGCLLSHLADQQAFRHRTALKRSDLSKPVKLALRDRIITQKTSVLDYGCGHGEDAELLASQGITVQGWDPVFSPLPLPQKADVVNLGYVLNVVENPIEREETLKKSWGLARKALVVSSLVREDKDSKSEDVAFGDGVLTTKGTFQKIFKQKELREYVERVTGTKAFSAEGATFYVFKSKALQTRYEKERSRDFWSPLPLTRFKVEVNNDLLKKLAEKVEELGRFPIVDEFHYMKHIRRSLKTDKQISKRIKRFLHSVKVKKAAQKRKEAVLILLASQRLTEEGRARLRELSAETREDIKVFFSSYSNACQEANALLFDIGDANKVESAIRESPMGKLMPNSLYVHHSAEQFLPLLLRIIVAVGKAYAGEIHPVTVYKIRRDGSAVSFSECEDFDLVDHPIVKQVTKVDFLKRKVEIRQFADSDNPPILHRKDAMVHSTHSHYQEFKKLTQEEESLGLLGRPDIGRLRGWIEAKQQALCASSKN